MIGGLGMVSLLVHRSFPSCGSAKTVVEMSQTQAAMTGMVKNLGSLTSVPSVSEM